jgi:hypothetical protein
MGLCCKILEDESQALEAETCKSLLPRGHCLGIRLAIFYTFGMICEGEKRVFAMGLAKGSEPW